MSAGRDFMNPEWVDKVMAQVQVYASARSLVGGRFDSGDMIETAAEEKAALRAMLEKANAALKAAKGGE